MSIPVESKHIIVIAIIVIKVLVLLPTLTMCACWMKKRTKGCKKIADEDVESICDKTSEAQNSVEKEKVEDIKTTEQEKNNDDKDVGSSAHDASDNLNNIELADTNVDELTDDLAHVRIQALSRGLYLIVYSCKGKLYTVKLAQSMQPDMEQAHVGVFNKGQQLKKGTLFGPYKPYKPCQILRSKKTQKYLKAFQKLELAHNWLGFINRATNPSDANIIIIEKTDAKEKEYYYEIARDIKIGSELLATIRWT